MYIPGEGVEGLFVFVFDLIVEKVVEILAGDEGQGLRVSKDLCDGGDANCPEVLEGCHEGGGKSVCVKEAG